MSDSQFGFGNNHSTCMPSLMLQYVNSNAIDVAGVVLALFIDFQKASDAVNHQIIM